MQSRLNYKTVRSEILDNLIRRMDIFLADLGEHDKTCVEGGIRPVVIISNNINNKCSPLITAAPISSKINRLYLPGHVLIFSNDVKNVTRKFKTGTILLEQITTIDKRQLIKLIGRIASQKRQRIINQRLKEFLALNRSLKSSYENRKFLKKYSRGIKTDL